MDLPDIKAQTPLLIAIQKKYTDCASALIKAGANPNGDPGNRSTPLYIAAQIGYVEGVKVIRQHLWGYSPSGNQFAKECFIDRLLYQHATFHSSRVCFVEYNLLFSQHFCVLPGLRGGGRREGACSLGKHASVNYAHSFSGFQI